MSSKVAFISAHADESSADARAWPSPARARWAVVAIATTSALASFDRAIITLVGEHMRRDLGLTDAQFGLVSGLAFALPLALIAIPVGRLADRAGRKAILIAGVGFWSVMTAICGLVRSFSLLVASRVGVGAGEAVIAPTALPLLADYHAPERRSRAISGYYVGAHVGQALAFIAGGSLVAWLDQRPVADAPFIGQVASWQLLFPIAGASGLVVMAFLFAVAEPPRREKFRPAEQRAIPGRETVRLVRLNLRAFAAVLLSPALVSIGFSGLLVFLPSLLQRAHGLPVDRAGAMIGLAGLPAAIVGTVLAGVLGDRVTRRSTRGGHAALLAWAIALATPLLIATTLAPSAGAAVGLLAGGLVFYAICLAVPPMAIQALTPNEMRGQLIGGLTLMTGLLGFGAGPLLAGLLSDALGSLPLALALMLAVTLPPAALIAFTGLGAYDRAFLRRHPLPTR